MNLPQLIENYFGLKQQICDYFGYKEDWVVIPFQDCLKYYWMLIGGDTGKVAYSDDPFTLESITSGERLYSGSVYTQRFLPKWVYRTKDHTMISVDTRTDGNKFLMIFDNTKEYHDENLKEAYREAWGSWG
jgi:hypothetical protein